MPIGRILLHGFWGLAVVLAVAAASFWIRGRMVGLPWTDEQYTLLVVHRTPARIVELCTADAHPPGYYFLLKLWLKPFRLAGIEPDAFAGRSLGLAWRLLALVLAWIAGRRAFGAAAGTVLAWMLCLSPRLLEVSAEMRQYSVFAPMLPVLFLTMMAAWRIETDTDEKHRRSYAAIAWTAYGAFAIVCLWCQLVASFALCAFGLAWIGMSLSLGRRMLRSTFFVGGALAQIAAVLAFAPWIGNVAANYGYLMGHVHTWMTPPTGGNLFSTAFGWMPFGQDFHIVPQRARIAIAVLSVLGTAVPVVAWIAVRLARRGADSSSSWLARAGLLALACGGAVVLAFWLQARFKVAQVFHGPRYPVAGLGTWTLGLGLLAIAAGTRVQRRWLAPALLSPWIAVSCAGLGWSSTHGVYSSMLDPIVQRPDAFPPAGEPLYILPPEFIPHARPAYGAWDLRRIEDLRKHPPDRRATVLHFSQWFHAGDPSIGDLLDAMINRRLSERGRQMSFTEASVLQLDDLRPEVVALIGVRPSTEFRRDSIGRAVSEAAPDWQNPVDGWYELEWEGPVGRPIRRAISSPAIARFDRPLPPGKYVMRIAGYQMPYPSQETEWQFRFLNEPEAIAVTISTWDFDLAIPVELTRGNDKPFVAIERPVWVPADWIEGSNDLRPFSFTLRKLWMEKAPED